MLVRICAEKDIMGTAEHNDWKNKRIRNTRCAENWAKSGKRLGAPRQIPRDCGPTDLDAELGHSPWMRGPPHNELAELIPRMRSRISAFVLGRPQRRDRHLRMPSDRGRRFDK